MSSVWDDPGVTAGQSEFVKFEKVGDRVSGHVTALGIKRWDDGSASPQLDLTTDDGEERTLTAGQVRLKLALAEKRPEVGDWIAVELTQIEKRSGGKTLKHFGVEHVKGGKAALAGAKQRLGSMAGSAAADDAPPF